MQRYVQALTDALMESAYEEVLRRSGGRLCRDNCTLCYLATEAFGPLPGNGALHARPMVALGDFSRDAGGDGRPS